MTLASLTAHAWGYDGHLIAADVASSLLTQQARIRVGEMLMGGSLADVASYMDDERKSLKHQIPGPDKWHYDNCVFASKLPPLRIPKLPGIRISVSAL